MMKIEISDDGGGIDIDRVFEKALKNGLFKSNSNSNGKGKPSDEEIIDLIFRSGFSTAEVVTEVSGRGVGMDFVKTSIEQIGGHVSVQTKRHVGTTFILNIPTPKTIMTEKTMLAKSNSIIVAVPISNVRKFLKCDNVAVTEFGGSRAITYQDQVIPMMTYNEMTMGQSETVSLRGKICVLLKDRAHLVALIVDEIIGPCDAVLRPLDLQILDKLCFKGITLLDTRTIAYILDVEKILAKAFEHKTEKTQTLEIAG